MSGSDRLGGVKTLNVTGFLDEFEKDDVKQKVDIVTLFESFGVKLDKQGKNYVGLCPFHDDKNPSLSVDREKKLYHCFGCGEGGDPFDLVMKMKGVGFKEALAYLKGDNYKTASPSPKLNPEKVPLSQGTRGTVTAVKISPAERPADESSIVNLTDLSNYYEKLLSESAPANTYLESRGLWKPEILKRLRVGFCRGDLKSKVSKPDYEKLKTAGIFTEKGGEHFKDCVVFPLLDDTGKVTGFYGRRVTSRKPSHLYLKGTHSGLLNSKAAKVYPERIIITESVIDAVSLLVLGVDNVIPAYGLNGFTDLHLKSLKDNRVKEICIAFDNDEAGTEGSLKLKDRLLSEGFVVREIFPENVKDWNEALLAGLSKEAFDNLVDTAESFEAPKDIESFKVDKQQGRYTFKKDNLEYRLLGVKDLFVSSLKVNIKASKGSKRDYDSVDLYSSRSRKTFSERMSECLDEDSVLIEKALLDILEYLEDERDKKLSPASREEKGLTEEEINLGMSFLKNKNMYEEVVRDVNELGYVSTGSQNILIVYIAALSRFFAEPLSVFVRGSSSGGKTALVRTVTKLIPDNDKWGAHDISEQSLHYVDDDKLNGKVVLMGEDLHDEKIEGKIRQMQSDHELTKLVTVKDEDSGRMRAEHIVKNVRLSFMITSTTLDVNLENISRCLILSVDESAGQTEKVHRKTGEKHLCVGMETELEKDRSKRIIRKHHLAQKLLKPV